MKNTAVRNKWCIKTGPLKEFFPKVRIKKKKKKKK